MRKILYSPVTLFFLALIFLFLLKSLWGAYAKASLSASNLEKEKAELERIKSREKTLAHSIEFLRTEQGIESEIRTKFRAVKEGESVAVILDSDSTHLSIASTTTIVVGFWGRIFGWFK